MEPELQGGFYSNRDSAYIYSHLSRLFGQVLVLTGRLPQTPQTYTSPQRMPGGQLRFWSLCTGESRVTVAHPGLPRRTARCWPAAGRELHGRRQHPRRSPGERHRPVRGRRGSTGATAATGPATPTTGW